MKRTDLEREMKRIGKSKGVVVTFKEGGNHTKVLFDGHVATMIGRHKEILESTARGAIRDAEEWSKS